MRTNRFRRQWTALAALTVGSCVALGGGCIQAVFAAIGATFYK